MTLPLSGTISLSDIRAELGIPSQVPFSLTNASTEFYVAFNPWADPKPNTAQPHAMSEWYGYNHLATAPAIASFAGVAVGNPLDGIIDLSWAYVSGSNLDVEETYIYYSYDATSWALVTVGFFGTATTTYTASMGGKPGFTSLDNTYFLLEGYANGTEVPSSPLQINPPY